MKRDGGEVVVWGGVLRLVMGVVFGLVDVRRDEVEMELGRVMWP